MSNRYLQLAVVRAVTAGMLSTVCLAGPPYVRSEFDATKTMGYEQCQKCHVEQVAILRRHTHFSHSKLLQRNPAAIQMAKAIGGTSVKRTARCVRCHYTPKIAYEPGQPNGDPKAISAISCESCHGPSKDWLLVHNDYGATTRTRETETDAHRTERIENSISRGMRHPSHVYTLARSCFGCHILDDEEIVNVAGHPVRSKGFDMVSWSQGNMRHNFFRTGGRHNAFSDPQRLRVMYVVSVLTEIEFSLRAASKSTAKARYAMEHAKHCRATQQTLAEICDRLPDPRLAKALETITGVRFSLSNAHTFNQAAMAISRIAWNFSLEPNGDLEAIQDLLPPAGKYVGVADR